MFHNLNLNTVIDIPAYNVPDSEIHVVYREKQVDKTHVNAIRGPFGKFVAGLVTCWFKLGRGPCQCLLSAFKAVHGGCIYYNVRKIVPSVDNAVTKSICTNVEP